MAANLVSVVMQFLTPDMIAKIASVLGIDRNIAQKAIGGAIPALLAGLADVTATPQGARQLGSSLAQQQPGSLDILKSLIGGSGQNNLAETGSGMLSGLFGGGALDTIAQSIGKFAGIDAQTSKSLLGMLGPVILGTLGQQQRSAGLDTNGLASLLGSQKDQIVAAIPSGLADHLTSAGLIDSAAGVARSGATAASAAAGRAAQATTRAASSQLPYWLAAVAILGALAWYVFHPGTETVAELPRPAQPGTATVGLAPSDLTIGGVSLTNKVNSSVGTLRSVLPTIKDAASAQAAIPKLREATTQLNEVSDLSGKLSPEGKMALAKLIATAQPAINQMCDNVLAMPGVGDVARPTIDELRRKIETLSKS